MATSVYGIMNKDCIKMTICLPADINLHPYEEAVAALNNDKYEKHILDSI